MTPEQLPAIENADYEYLFSQGFLNAEARGLIRLKEHLPERIEYREKVEEQNRLNFARWLFEHKRLES